MKKDKVLRILKKIGIVLAVIIVIFSIYCLVVKIATNNFYSRLSSLGYENTFDTTYTLILNGTSASIYDESTDTSKKSETYILDYKANTYIYSSASTINSAEKEYNLFYNYKTSEITSYYSYTNDVGEDEIYIIGNYNIKTEDFTCTPSIGTSTDACQTLEDKSIQMLSDYNTVFKGYKLLRYIIK